MKSRIDNIRDILTKSLENEEPCSETREDDDASVMPASRRVSRPLARASRTSKTRSRATRSRSVSR